MIDILSIDGKSIFRIKDEVLARYLSSLEAAGYFIQGSKYKNHESGEFRDVLMIGKREDFDRFFRGEKIQELFTLEPDVKRIVFKEGEILVYFLKKNYGILPL